MLQVISYKLRWEGGSTRARTHTIERSARATFEFRVGRPEPPPPGSPSRVLPPRRQFAEPEEVRRPVCGTSTTSYASHTRSGPGPGRARGILGGGPMAEAIIISGTSGGRISALDDSLNNFSTFLEKEFNKEKECAKTLFNWSSARGSDTSFIARGMTMLHYILLI